MRRKPSSSSPRGPAIRTSSSALLAALLASAAPGGAVPFSEHVITNAADGAASVYATDVDGDGDVDVLSASSGDDSIRWFENSGMGLSFTEHVITSTADGAASVFAIDVDGDGDTDVLSASTNDDTVAWYENEGGDPVLFTTHVITDAADRAISVFAIDLDGDGDVDVLSASANDNTIRWYENDGAVDPVFTARVISSTALGALSVFAIDVDGDGDVDALSASTFGVDKIAWYENDGAADPLFTEHVISSMAIGSTSVYAADLDDDGDTDVLSSSGFDDKIAWYENDGAPDPAFAERVISTGADFARSVFAADVDGDDRMDVLSASSSDDTVAWYENDGAAPPQFAEFVISTTAGGAASVFATDIDGDGDTDALSAASVGDTIAWYENTAPDPCGEDVDGDGMVGFSDLLIILSTWGPCPAEGPCPGDVNDDGEVDAADLRLVLDAWGPCPDGGPKKEPG